VHLVEILRLDAEGDGIAAIGGRDVRVPQVIPGERVEVRLHSSRADEAELVRVVRASPCRVSPGCRHFGPCGGCAWQHIAYGEQLRLKQALLQRLLDAALGPGAPKAMPTLPTPEAGPGTRLPGRGEQPEEPVAPWQYRNKAHFVFGPGARGRALSIGHYRRRSRTVLPVTECPVHPEEGNRKAFAMRDALERAGIPGVSADAADGIARHIVVRVGESSGDTLTTLVVAENVKPLRRVTADFAKGAAAGRAAGEKAGWGLYLNVNDRPGPYLFGRETRYLAGAREIRETVADLVYIVSPTSFFQTNVRAARVLVGEVLGALGDRSYRRVLDLYAGVGLFALPLARDGRTVTAVEESREAMAAAAAAARENRVPEHAFRAIAAPVEETMSRLTPRRAVDAWDAVVLDPPRQGCPPPVFAWILRTLRPRRIVYVSCNPEALAADLRLAPATGYAIASVQPLDMFPHTAHIESVAVLDRM
jgi:23S rRNA (uracil1939-C5)-methyltransferase